MKYCALILLILSAFFGSTQSEYVFIENKGQWHSNIQYNQLLANGNLFLEKDGFTYSLYEKSYIHQLHTDKTTAPPSIIKSHAIKTKFVNCNENVVLTKKDQSPYYHNYYLGSDESTWQSRVFSSSEIVYEELYSGIDLVVRNRFDQTKYDFVVKPSGKTYEILIAYHGVDSLYLKNGRLVVQNSIDNFEEAAPYAFQYIEGEKVEVSCHYVVRNNTVSFAFPYGYDTTKELIIDPIVVFASFTGSTADNFGFTATYDNNDNTYVGGIVFGQGVYPTTLGAFQTSYNTSPWFYVDVAISKFNANGTSLLYSTYIGGSMSEAPHSLVVNDQDELFVFGTTGSSNYPVSNSGYDTSFNGGIAVSAMYSGVYYFQGADIFVTKFNSTGTNLLGSTYVGGTNNDGMNTDTLLAYNYGDGFRGEIIIDSSGNPIIATTTNSLNFPVTLGAPQTIYGGGFSDACIFKLNPTLSAITWSSFYGGSQSDAGYGVSLDSRGNVFTTGGTRSSNLPMPIDSYDTTFNGQEDGFVSKYNLVSNTLVSSTFIGTSSYDQSYFVQIDINDEVYITGQSMGSYPVSSGVYSNANSKQFFHKFDNNLDSSYWSTVVGSGRSTVDFSPSAFLVNDCGLIYLSGWGGTTNRFYRATASSTAGLPTTADGYQLTTDNSDFYLMVLSRDASSLQYGTFFGGVSHEHVDGGTSRFDKKGSVYQAVCAGCGGNNGFPTTPGAWSRTNNSSNCNLGVIKMNVSYIKTIASLPVPFLCLPDSASFTNSSSGGNTYKWYFGDGDSSSVFAPTHIYQDTGLYMVTLIVSDSTGCIPPDTAQVVVHAYEPKSLLIDSVPVICPGDSVLLQARNGQSYQWSQSTFLSNDTIANPIAFPAATTTYQLISGFYCNIDTALVTVHIDSTLFSISPDTIICKGSSVLVSAYGGERYQWYPAIGLSNDTISTPIITPLVPTTYFVDFISINGCVHTDSIRIDFHQDSMTISPDTSLCFGDSMQLSSSGGGSYNWSGSSGISNRYSQNPFLKPTVSSNLRLTITTPNGCLLTDSLNVIVFNDSHSISPDTAICPNQSTILTAAGGIHYLWKQPLFSRILSSPMFTVSPSITTQYSVIITSANGCKLYDTVEVEVIQDTISIINDTAVCPDVTTSFWASGGQSYAWSPVSGMLNSTTSNPIVSPVVPTTYFVDVVSTRGCYYRDSVFIDIHTDSMSITPDTSICKGERMQFNSSGGGTYSWFPATGLSSNSIMNPGVIGNQTTQYFLNVVSFNGCLLNDSVLLTVFQDSMAISPDTTLCIGDTIGLSAMGGGTYSWVGNSLLSAFNQSTISVNPSTNSNYYLQVVSSNGCVLNDSVFVQVHNESSSVSDDTTICANIQVQLTAYGGISYAWNSAAPLSSLSSSNPTSTPVVSSVYNVTIYTPLGCVKNDSITITIDTNKIHSTLSPDTVICYRRSVPLFATGGTSYSWSPAGYLSSTSGASTIASPDASRMFYVDIANACFFKRDSVFVGVSDYDSVYIPDDIICLGDKKTIQASGAVQYSWKSDSSIISGIYTSMLEVQPVSPTVYELRVVDTSGCMDTVDVLIDLYPISKIEAGADRVIDLGETTYLTAKGDSGLIVWTPAITLNCSYCRATQAFPDQETEYIVVLEDANGCYVADSVLVEIGGVLRVPNSFTPNGDGINDVFYATSLNVTKFTIQIFNRWGELIFESDDTENGWDGTYKGKLCQIDSYVWRISYSHLTQEKKVLTGHVILVK